MADSKKEVRVPIGDHQLPGTLTVPESAKGLVIFVHGSGSSRLSPRNVFVANVLNQQGIATLLFDLLTPLEDTDIRAAVTWLRNKSAAIRKDLTGSVMIREKNRFYNRLVWAKPNGSMVTYDKKHLFAYAGEDKVYTAGTSRVLVELNGWRIRPFICYDLRFPIWCRNLDLVYDLALFVANWPEKRSAHWRALLPARAIENQAYVIGVNRVGSDGNNYEHRGDSAVIDPLGTVLFEQSWEECIHTVTLPGKPLAEYRSQFPAWRDADRI